MMMIVLDADGLIKLGKAGLIEPLSTGFKLYVCEAVYLEAVVLGMKHAYPDAVELEKAHAEGYYEVYSPTESNSIPWSYQLHRGERATLTLFHELGARAIVSDDLAFLRYLLKQGLPFLRVADFISTALLRQVLTPEQACTGLHSIRPLITGESYHQALDKIKERSESDGK